MSKYTAEQVEVVAGIHEDVRFADEKNRDKLADKTSAMLRGYAALLRERESAKAAVTDEIAERVLNQYVKNCLPHLDEAPVSLRIEAMRAALEAVALMLASARVPDGWQLVPINPTDEMIEKGTDQHECVQGDSWYTDLPISENDCNAIYKAMLAAAPKPEKDR